MHGHAAYMNYPDEFAGLQSRTAYEAYYLPAQRGMLSNYGINIKEYSPGPSGDYLVPGHPKWSDRQ